MNHDHILIATDLLDDEALFTGGVATARKLGARSLTLIHVFDPAAGLAPIDFGMPTPMADIVDQYEEGVVAALEHHRDRYCKDSGLDVQVLAVRHPSAGWATVDWAETNEVDLIIVGSHGRTGIKRAFLGSVAERIVRHAGRPVLVIPNTSEAASDD